MEIRVLNDQFKKWAEEVINEQDDLWNIKNGHVRIAYLESDVEKKSGFMRVLDAILDGGMDGVAIGKAIIPGVLVISTIVMMLTFGPADASKGYAGVAYEGVPVIPWLAGKIDFIFDWLFG